MKINDPSHLGAVASPGANGIERPQSGENARGSQGAGSDRAELSGRAGKIAEALGQDAASRAATVERLRLEVAHGQYKPDPGAVSRAIVGDALAQGAAAGGTGKK